MKDEVYSELYDVLGRGDKIMSIDEILKLVYLDQVIKETMRLFPTIPYILRNLQADVKIREYTSNDKEQNLLHNLLYLRFK